MCSPRTSPKARTDDECLPFRYGTAVEDRQHDHFFAVHVFRKKGQWRSLAQHGPDIELLGCRIYELTILGEYLSGLAERKNYQPRENFGPHRKELEFELGDHAKVSTAASKCPEKIRVFFFTRAYFLAIGRDHIDGDKIVDGHAVFASQPAEAAA